MSLYGRDSGRSSLTLLTRLSFEWPSAQVFPGVDQELAVRRQLLKKFPYAVVYLELDAEIVIVAIAHGHEKPGYWRDRPPR